MDNEKIIIGITQGDINGIGYEVILKTLAEPRVTESFVAVIYGSPKAAAFYRRRYHRLFLRHRGRCDGGRLCAVLCHSGLYQRGRRRVEEAGAWSYADLLATILGGLVIQIEVWIA